MAGTLIGQLVWKITGDNSGLDKSVKSAEASVSKFSKFMQTAGTAFTGFWAFQVGRSLVKAASDAQETAQKFGVVFSSVTDQANAAAKALQNNYGLARTESKKLLSDTGDLLTGFGFTQQEALNLSMQVQELAVDLASFTNYAGGAEGASQALTKALLGEREQVKSLGIAILESDLEAYAASLGKNWRELSKVEKAQLTFNVALAQSGNAVGDFARSSDSAANTWRRLSAQLQNAQEDLGNQLLPGLTAVGDAMIELAKDGSPLLAFFNSLVKIVGAVFKGLALLNLGIQDVLNSAKISGLNNAMENNNKILAQILPKYAGIVQYGRELSTVEGLQYMALIKRDRIAQGEYKRYLEIKIANRQAMDEATRLSEQRIDISERVNKLATDETVAVQRTISAREKERSLAQQRAREEYVRSQNFKKGVEGNADAYSSLIIEAKEFGLTLDNYAERQNYINELKEKSKTATKDEKKAIQEVILYLQEMQKQADKTWEAMSGEERFKQANELFQTLAGNMINIFSSAEQLVNNLAAARIAALDEEMQAELEAAGLAEDTAVEKAQKEYDDALANADADTQIEKKKALDKAKIEEDYQKRKAKIEYDAAMAAWGLQVAMATIQIPMAIMNAITAGWAAAAINPFLAIWYPALLGSLAGIASGLQLGAVIAAKPKKPKFASGGIVPGSSYYGDNVAAQLNSREMVLNDAQQARLFDVANGRGAGGNMQQVAPISRENILDWLFKASQNGDLFIANRAVVAK